eukprot:Hpha_TRINITY_DN16867_c2_g2::TRINITY_DN16867_c2_g2_i2::g.149164::m.149164
MVSQLRRVSCCCDTLLTMVGVVQLPGGLYAVAERLPDAETVRGYAARRLRRCRPLTVGEIATVAERLSEALEMLHSQDIPHRDLSSLQAVISPSKDDVSERSTIRVRRFGITRAPPRMEFTSPESIKTRRFSSASDIWALGATLWDLVSYAASSPFKSDDQDQVREEILERAEAGNVYCRPPNCPADLWDRLVAPCFRPIEERPSAATVRSVAQGMRTDAWKSIDIVPFPEEPGDCFARRM